MDQSPPGQSPQGFASEDEEATYCLSLLRDGDRHQKIVARERLGTIFEQRGMLDEAAQCFESNIREGVRDPRIYQRLAGVYRRQGRHELADEVLVEARRLAERMTRPPGPGQRRPGPGRPMRPGPPGPPQQPIVDVQTAQLPVASQPGPGPAPQPQMPADQPRSRQPQFPGDEFGLEVGGPPPGYGLATAPSEQPAVAARPWWLSPAMVVLVILLCGPYGIALMWVRGGYSKPTRVRVTAIWGALMILMLAASAVSLQSQLPLLLTLAGSSAGVGLRAEPTPIVFPSAPSAAQKPGGVGAAPTPPPINIPAGALPTRPTGTTVGAPPAGAPPGAEPKPDGATAAPAPAEPKPAEKPVAAEKPTAGQPSAERMKVKDTGGTGANMRDKPGQTGTVVKTLPEGTVVEVIGPDRPMDGRTWKNVKDDSGGQGWIAAELLEPA